MSSIVNAPLAGISAGLTDPTAPRKFPAAEVVGSSSPGNTPTCTPLGRSAGVKPDTAASSTKLVSLADFTDTDTDGTAGGVSESSCGVAGAGSESRGETPSASESIVPPARGSETSDCPLSTIGPSTAGAGGRSSTAEAAGAVSRAPLTSNDAESSAARPPRILVPSDMRIRSLLNKRK